MGDSGNSGDGDDDCGDDNEWGGDDGNSGDGGDDDEWGLMMVIVVMVMTMTMT